MRVGDSVMIITGKFKFAHKVSAIEENGYFQLKDYAGTDKWFTLGENDIGEGRKIQIRLPDADEQLRIDRKDRAERILHALSFQTNSLTEADLYDLERVLNRHS